MKSRPERKFWFRLARQIGGCTVRELQTRMDSREFTEWMIFDRMEPGEPTQSALQSASICAWIHAANKGKDAESPPLEDFMVKIREPETRQSRMQRLKNTVLTMAQNLKGRK